MTSYPIANSTYYVYATALIFTFTPFVIACGNKVATITYTATSNATTLPTFITLTSASQQFSIYTILESNVNTYNIIVTGTATIGGVAVTASSSWVLTVLSGCTFATVTASAPTAQSYLVT